MYSSLFSIFKNKTHKIKMQPNTPVSLHTSSIFYKGRFGFSPSSSRL